MNTADMLREAGLWPVLAVLGLALAVLLLRVLALPLAGAALLLDSLADYAARPLNTTAAGNGAAGTGVSR
ncbi:hypothetical protein [Thermomonospora cellulosilytica]|uniref:Uncharacterized protein n=1 Tax=Thermomonospora cellulosilytica TaxID=1411118 RepID=A0A7W3R6X2_9ACTN|nr:hypothetical protein [Thermomonospora cellulosilytica]MBA9002057.1 hypothetical protein [Thermomonospora cellulosilytica]